ncbi:MAG: pyridoxine/pyridoxamine 5'-phosphate oxidase [Paracoccaceae bacterium]|nr:MAG: pyridoxamine 5'-phosphate oxidase [Alphaproteobacteria bacterium]GIX12185.1 MAG: pyridoxine/pyridoxamine 5'-phosphate oxidase [Paracoccaceae bacterium]
MAEPARRKDIFAGEDPIEIARRWLAEAAESEPADPEAMALATVDDRGMPNVRMVLLKEIEGRGARGAFLFYTNYESVKARELAAGKAAFVLHWKSLRRQVRVRGLVTREDGPKADAYFASRPLQSRIGAWASRQSRPLRSRAALMAEVAKQAALHGNAPRRPPHWGGFRIRPLEIEFWAEGAYRLHDRFRWTRPDVGSAQWTVTRLYP